MTARREYREIWGGGREDLATGGQSSGPMWSSAPQQAPADSAVAAGTSLRIGHYPVMGKKRENNIITSISELLRDLNFLELPNEY